MCIDIVKIWIGIAKTLEVICPRHAHIFILDDNLSKCQGILTKLVTCIDMKEIWFGIANGQILSQCLTELSAHNMIMAGYYSLMF